MLHALARFFEVARHVVFVVHWTVLVQVVQAGCWDMGISLFSSCWINGLFLFGIL